LPSSIFQGLAPVPSLDFCWKARPDPRISRSRIVEVPISYAPRSKEEGKKIGARDWFIGVRTFWRYRNG
jgi:hypothetical protein